LYLTTYNNNKNNNKNRTTMQEENVLSAGPRAKGIIRQKKDDVLRNLRDWLVRHTQRPKMLSGLVNSIIPMLCIQISIDHLALTRALTKLNIVRVEKNRVAASLSKSKPADILLALKTDPFCTVIGKQVVGNVLAWIKRCNKSRCLPKCMAGFTRGIKHFCTVKLAVDPGSAVQYLKDRGLLSTNSAGECLYDVSAKTAAQAAAADVASLSAADSPELILSFDDFGLNDELLRRIYSYGFEHPSAIQQRSIGPMLAGRDVIAQAQSGSGKTAAYVIPLLGRIDPSLGRCVQAMVLVPSREIAQQVYNCAVALGEGIKSGVSVHKCVGGTGVRECIRALQKGVHVVVGTTGRIADMINRGALEVDTCTMLVVDEADAMLGKGSINGVHDIFKFMPQNVQTAIFSATMPHTVLEVAKKFMLAPVHILVESQEAISAHIKQFHVATETEKWKLDTLCDLYDLMSSTQTIVYAESNTKVDWLVEKMSERDFVVSAVHGDMDQRDREIIMREFRSGSSRVLITTDLLARGIDVQQVTLVINYNLPAKMESYIHRIGRSGRFGRKGVAVTFVNTEDVDRLRHIEQICHTQIEEMPMGVGDLV
jgi:translation initiation factor 4A